MTKDQFDAVEKFADGLTGCFTERYESLLDSKDPIEQMEKSTLNYVLSVIRIHKDLAEISFNKEADDQDKYFEDKQYP